jgi:transcriptional regulator with XRE-family HTH domain
MNNDNEFPRMTNKEYRFIRQMAGLSMAKLARINGIRSRSTISNWEIYQDEMKPFQIKMLLNATEADVFQECRRLWAEKLEREKSENEKRQRQSGYISQRYYPVR